MKKNQKAFPHVGRKSGGFLVGETDPQNGRNIGVKVNYYSITYSLPRWIDDTCWNNRNRDLKTG